MQLAKAIELVRGGKPAEALPLLTLARKRERTLGPAHIFELEALISIGDIRIALSLLEAAASLSADNPDAVDALAFCARRLGEHALSLQLYTKAANLAPMDPQGWYNLATSERSFGNLEAARQACERALGLNPDFRPALILRSEVTRATPTTNNVDELRARVAAASSGMEAAHLLYALGKELHELGDYDRAFEAFAAGARQRRAALKYDVRVDELKLKRIRSVFPTSLRNGARGAGERDIFIVGLPRTGTTLMERILGGLDDVRSNDETENFSTALMRGSPQGPGDVFDRAARADRGEVANLYAALSNPLGRPERIIEKLPFNYLYVGPILEALPGASIFWLRRNPIDSCFAMFRTMFGAAYPFSYDFDELARYYAAYRKLMSHWEQEYGDRISFVDYEELVADADRVVRPLAERSGLKWTSGALEIANNQSASLTASAAQVRGGIYSSSVDIWTRYERHLEPLVEKLNAAGVPL